MVPTYMLQVKIGDLSGNMFIQFTGQLGDTIMGMSAKEFADLRERAKDSGDSETMIRNFLIDNVLNKVTIISLLTSAVPPNIDQAS